MKKQILILVVAIFASVVAFAQPSNPPSCLGDPLHPSVGQQYAYTVSIPTLYTGYNGDGTYKWWVTQDVDLITGAVATDGTDFKFLASGVYNTATAATPTVNITWNSTALGKGNYYLVIQYVETNTNATISCPTNNYKVMLITPQNTFWLKIENVLNAAGAAGGDEVCSPGVLTATITNTTDPGAVEYIYGKTTHFVKISANGYTGDFTPSLKLGDLLGDAEYTSVTWASGAKTGTFTESATAGIWTSSSAMPSLNTYNPGDPTGTPVVPASWGTGQEIIVTIEITHNHHQGLIDMPITIAIDGSYDSGGTAMNDKKGGTTCDDEAEYADTTTQTVRARPGINAVAPAFVPDPTTQQ